MTNITLSIDDETYKKMKKFSEIKWSSYVREIISKRVEELSKLESQGKEGIMAMFASEEILKKDWDNEYDEVYNDL